MNFFQLQTLHRLIIMQVVFATSFVAAPRVNGSAFWIIWPLLTCVASATLYTFALAVLYSRSPLRTSTAFLVALATVFGFSQRLTASANELFIVFLPIGINIAMFVGFIISWAWPGLQGVEILEHEKEPSTELMDNHLELMVQHPVEANIELVKCFGFGRQLLTALVPRKYVDLPAILTAINELVAFYQRTIKVPQVSARHSEPSSKPSRHESTTQI